VIEPWVLLDSSCKYRGDSVGSGTTDIFVSGASLGEDRSAADDGAAASTVQNRAEPRKSGIPDAIDSLRTNKPPF